MKLQEGSFYTQAALPELGPPTNVTSVPTPVKSRHWLGLDIWGIPGREKYSWEKGAGRQLPLIHSQSEHLNDCLQEGGER